MDEWRTSKLGRLRNHHSLITLSIYLQSTYLLPIYQPAPQIHPYSINITSPIPFWPNEQLHKGHLLALPRIGLIVWFWMYSFIAEFRKTENWGGFFWLFLPDFYFLAFEFEFQFDFLLVVPVMRREKEVDKNNVFVIIVVWSYSPSPPIFHFPIHPLLSSKTLRLWARLCLVCEHVLPWIVTYVYWEMEIVGQGCDLAGGEVFVRVTFLETAFHLFFGCYSEIAWRD